MVFRSFLYKNTVWEDWMEAMMGQLKVYPAPAEATVNPDYAVRAGPPL